MGLLVVVVDDVSVHLVVLALNGVGGSSKWSRNDDLSIIVVAVVVFATVGNALLDYNLNHSVHHFFWCVFL